MPVDDLAFWSVFFSAALVLNLSPGPDLVYILSRTLTQGTRVGMASAAGVCTGALVHVLAAAWGLSAILATSATAFLLVKYAGAAYLFYLGVKALRSAGTTVAYGDSQAMARVSPWKAFSQGVVIDVLNPKVALFFMAFLPQFVRDGHGPVAQQLALLGVLVIAVAIVVEALLVLAAARSRHLIQNHPGVSVWLDRAFGGLLLGLALRLALAEQRA